MTVRPAPGGAWKTLGFVGLLLLLAGPAGAWYKHVASPRYHTVGRASGLLMGIRRSPYLWRRDSRGEPGRSPDPPAPSAIQGRRPEAGAGGPGSPAPRGREPAALARLALQDLIPRRTSARHRLPLQSGAGLPPRRAPRRAARRAGSREQPPPPARGTRRQQPGTEDGGGRRHPSLSESKI